MSAPKKPKTIYWYENYKLQRHHIGPECMPLLVCDDHEGLRYRCRTERHDHYGYSKIENATHYETKDARWRMGRESRWLQDLGFDVDVKITPKKEEPQDESRDNNT